MEVLIVLMFVSVVFLGGAALFLLRGIHAGDYDHADRLSLLPLEADDRRDGVSISEGEGNE